MTAVKKYSLSLQGYGTKLVWGKFDDEVYENINDIMEFNEFYEFDFFSSGHIICSDLNSNNWIWQLDVYNVQHPEDGIYVAPYSLEDAMGEINTENWTKKYGSDILVNLHKLIHRYYDGGNYHPEIDKYFDRDFLYEGDGKGCWAESDEINFELQPDKIIWCLDISPEELLRSSDFHPFGFFAFEDKSDAQFFGKLFNAFKDPYSYTEEEIALEDFVDIIFGENKILDWETKLLNIEDNFFLFDTTKNSVNVNLFKA